jgi:hypothetical protein
MLPRLVTYTHASAYQRFPYWSPVAAPAILVELYYGHDIYDVTAMVDTGADWPIFNKRDAERYLGIDFSNAPVEYMKGVAGERQAYVQRVGLRFGPLPNPVPCEVRFVENWTLPPLLGRIGGLSNVVMGLDERNRQVLFALP